MALGEIKNPFPNLETIQEAIHQKTKEMKKRIKKNMLMFDVCVFVFNQQIQIKGRRKEEG